MKIFLILSMFLLCATTLAAQKNQKYIEINFGLEHPVIESDFGFPPHYFVDQQIEIQYCFKTINEVDLLTGISYHSGKYATLKDDNHLVWVESMNDWFPSKGTKSWNLNYHSIEIPLLTKIQPGTSFPDYFITGIDIGWIWKYKLTGSDINNNPYEKISRTYLDINFAVQKNLFTIHGFVLGFSPGIGLRYYSASKNDWQNPHFFYGIKIISKIAIPEKNRLHQSNSF